MTQKDKELIIGWFQHIAQIATDRKTLNGETMEDWAALDEIKSIAKNSVYYIQNHIKEITMEKDYIKLIKAEIERLKGQLIHGACSSQVCMETNCKEEAYNEVLAFIDSLPEDESTCPLCKGAAMTEEERKLLLIDLCGRLPYGIIITSGYGDFTEVNYSNVGNISLFIERIFNSVDRPCLRPMSSMTGEEKKELNNYIFSEKGLRYFWFDEGIMYNGSDNQCFIGLGNDTIDKMIDWLNAHHFDYRNLIEKGLALEAPEGMYNK